MSLLVAACALLLATWTRAHTVRAAPGADRAKRPASTAAVPKKRVPQAPLASRTPGCLAGPKRGSGSFVTHSMMVEGQARTYHLRVPKTYRSTRAYPLIFRFHGRGGNGLSGGLDIEQHSGDEAIVVAPDGLEQSWSHRSERQDLALFDALLASLTRSYCVDGRRVFAYGFSAGARFSELLACKRSRQLRAIAAIAGFDDTPIAHCEGRVAAWLAHDRDDSSYATIERGIVARDRLREQNRCALATVPEGECVRYQGCAAGYPVIWCQTEGRGHDIRGADAPAKVWKFFSRLPRVGM